LKQFQNQPTIGARTGINEGFETASRVSPQPKHHCAAEHGDGEEDEH
jgi:hypothetical protein